MYNGGVGYADRMRENADRQREFIMQQKREKNQSDMMEKNEEM